MKHVVYLGSETANPIGILTQVHHLSTAYRACNVVNFDPYPDINTHNLARHIGGQTRNGDILHISAHGEAAGIYIKDAVTGNPTLVTTDQLATFLQQHRYKVVYIDACDSKQVVDDLANDPRLSIKLAIGFKGPINVTAAYLGSRAFHNILAKGQKYGEAVDTLRETVYMLDLADRLHVCDKVPSLLSESLLPMPEVVARFAIDRPIAKVDDDCFHLEFGAYGFDFIRGERCVVSFFSDDETLVGGAFTTVESGAIRQGQVDPGKGFFWTNNYRAAKRYSELWEVTDCDFSIYMSYFYDGEFDIVKATVKEALQNYYMSGKFNVPDEDKAKALPIIDQLP